MTAVRTAESTAMGWPRVGAHTSVCGRYGTGSLRKVSTRVEPPRDEKGPGAEGDGAVAGAERVMGGGAEGWLTGAMPGGERVGEANG
jgi:hypothetical protein